ncbi:MAG: hypothetical protein O2884_13690 [Chloroflexi bacterium]|nr:hypothetical protein [Chloroflexota bacterium]
MSISNDGRRRVPRRRAREMSTVAVIGTGYVGLVAGICFAEIGNQVICVDISEERVASLSEGKVPYYEPGLADLLRSALDNQSIGFTTDVSWAARDSKVIFITVGTPSNEDGSSNTDAIFGIAREIALTTPGPRTIVLKSTANVGTAAWEG